MKNTYMQKKEEVVRNWYVIDAEGLPLGRVATKAAHVLRGKHKVTYTPNIDCGDNVVIINASKVVLTGDKLDKKIYYNHSGYTGGLRERTAKVMKEQYPVEMVERAVKVCYQMEDLEDKCIRNYLYMQKEIIHMQLKNQLS